MKKGKKILAAFLAVLMVVAIMPFTMFSGLFSSKADAAEGGKKFTFEATSLTAAEAGTYKDGQSVSAGTDNYFTLYMSAKTKIDSNSKTWDDGYTSGQRVNFGGKADVPNMKNLFSFKTSNAAKVTVWWVEGGDDNRQVIIYDASGKEVVKTDAKAAKNVAVVSSLELTEAGTYYLGGDINNNYFFKIEVEEEAPKPVVKEYDLQSSSLTAAEAGTYKDGQSVSAGTDNYFTLYMSAKTKIDSNSKTWDDGYTSGQRINFGGKADVSNMKNVVSFKTEGTAKVTVWWVEGGDDNRQVAIYDASGKEVVKTDAKVAKNVAVVSSLELTEAGTYYLGGDINNNYIFRVKVVDTVGGGSAPVERKDWASVAAPVIGDITVDGDTVTVPFTMVIGNDGADKVSVVMTDASGKTETKGYAMEGDSGKVVFSPSASGKYTFAISASRENETDKTGNTAKCDFAYPLSAPSINSATSMGDGKVSIVWQSVKEATSYNVYVDGKNVGSTKDTSYEVSGLTVGTKYEFAVEAVRETPAEKSEKSEISATATADAKQVWGYIVYGDGANESNSAYEGSVNETGSVTLTSGKLTDGKFTGSGNNGKLVPASKDGLNFYYTSVPTSLNFTLRAKVTVDQWLYTNGQDGFGLMAADKLGGSGWNNSYMAVVSKSEYYWNEEEGKVTNDTTARKVTQKIGIASQEKKGITKDNLLAIEAGDTQTINNNFSSTMYPLEQRYAANVNLIGNATKDVADTIENPITEMYLTIQKNNTGYFVTYESVDGSYSTTKKYYDTDILWH
ncbi:MAG: fibronectin type III domain-containing protein [Clostridia bacterium]|nr:fibronectin type III domain-containing protein [Clostridia bacterium]